MGQSQQIETSARQTPIASWRHTARLVTILVGLAVAGMFLQGRGTPGAGAVGPHASLAPLYASLIAGEWLLFRAVVGGLKSTGTRWRALIGRSASGWKDVASDGLLGLLLCAAWITVVSALTSSTSASAAIRSLLPQGALEVGLWIVLSVSAGFCEELTFRGYFQRQFEALTRSAGAALVLQAALFGIAHAYQGARSVLAIAGYGVAFGALAWWRRNLRAGMLAHVATDLILGLVGGLVGG